jgi:predicted TIM-barrel fold metal-dependent hydrolase
MRTITLEEHFATPRFLDGPGRDLKEQAEKFNNARELKLIPQLCDLGDKRIAEMDAAGIDMQIVSLTAPGVEQLEAAEAIALAADTNDFVADAIKKRPARFGGFAALPTAVPDKAAQELERRVRGQKFAGAIINGHNRGRYLDDKFFWPILESAEQLGAPIYLHPTRPPQPVIDASFSGFSPMVSEIFSGPGCLAHRNRGPRHPPHPRRRIRPLSEVADRHRPSRRRASRHVPAPRHQTRRSCSNCNPLSRSVLMLGCV